MNSTHEIDPLIPVHPSWLLPLALHKPDKVIGDYFFYKSAQEALHVDSNQYCWSMYYVESEGRISVYVPPMTAAANHGTCEDVILHSQALNTGARVNVLRSVFGADAVQRIENLPPGLREILFIRHHHPNPLVRDTIKSAIDYTNIARESSDADHIHTLLYSTL